MTNEKLLGALTLGKGWAILGVLFFHYVGDLVKLEADGGSALLALVATPAKVGSQGVLYFFFASGFGLMFSTIRRGVSSERNREFVTKRLMRLYPPYVAAIMLVVMAYYLTGVEMHRLSILGVTADLLFLRNFFWETIKGLNGNWWFIATIVQLYLVYMLLSPWLRRAKWSWIIFAGLTVDLFYKGVLLLALTTEALAFDAADLNPYTTFFLNYCGVFMAGVAAARLFSGEGRNDIDIRIVVPALLSIALIGECIGYFMAFTLYGRVMNDLFFAIGYISFIFGLSLWVVYFFPPWFGVILTFFASISYELYLIHHPVIKIVLALSDRDNLFVLTSMIVLCSTGCAVGIQQWINLWRRRTVA